MKIHVIKSWGFAILLILSASICSNIGNGSNTSSSLSTIAQPVTKKPTISIPTAKYDIPPATRTQPVSLNACVTSSTIRMRENPGTEFAVIGGLTSGTCFKIIGRNKDSSWANILTSENVKGWVAAWLITSEGNVNSLPVTSNIISLTPTPNLVGNQLLSDIQPTKKNNSSNNSSNNNSNNSCHPAYPSVCIPTGRDRDCKDIPYRNFSVPGADPFNFDGDGDGIGCET